MNIDFKAGRDWGREEEGAVTADFTALAAAVLLLGLGAAYAIFSKGVSPLTKSVSMALGSADLSVEALATAGSDAPAQDSAPEQSGAPAEESPASGETPSAGDSASAAEQPSATEDAPSVQPESPTSGDTADGSDSVRSGTGASYKKKSPNGKGIGLQSAPGINDR